MASINNCNKFSSYAGDRVYQSDAESVGSDSDSEILNVSDPGSFGSDSDISDSDLDSEVAGNVEEQIEGAIDNAGINGARSINNEQIDRAVLTFVEFCKNPEKCQKILGPLDLLQLEFVKSMEDPQGVLINQFMDITIYACRRSPELRPVVDLFNRLSGENYQRFVLQCREEILRLPFVRVGTYYASPEQTQNAQEQLMSSLTPEVRESLKNDFDTIMRNIPNDPESQFSPFEKAFCGVGISEGFSIGQIFENLIAEGQAKGKITEEACKILRGRDQMKICENLVRSICSRQEQ